MKLPILTFPKLHRVERLKLLAATESRMTIRARVASRLIHGYRRPLTIIGSEMLKPYSRSTPPIRATKVAALLALSASRNPTSRIPRRPPTEMAATLVAAAQLRPLAGAKTRKVEERVCASYHSRWNPCGMSFVKIGAKCRRGRNA